MSELDMGPAVLAGLAWLPECAWLEAIRLIGKIGLVGEVLDAAQIGRDKGGMERPCIKNPM